MCERLRNAALANALLTVAATVVLATLVLHLWNADLGVPFLPGGTGYLQLVGWRLTPTLP
jgi:hypothetical protein